VSKRGAGEKRSGKKGGSEGKNGWTYRGCLVEKHLLRCTLEKPRSKEGRKMNFALRDRDAKTRKPTMLKEPGRETRTSLKCN